MKRTEVGSEERDPDKQSCHDTQENVPRFVKIVRQTSCDKGKIRTCGDE